MPQEIIPQRIYKTDDFTENWVKMNQSVLRKYCVLISVFDGIRDFYDIVVYKLKQLYDIVVNSSREFIDCVKSILLPLVERLSDLFPPTIDKNGVNHNVKTYQHYPHRDVNKFYNKRVNTKGYSQYRIRAVCRSTC